MDFHTASLCMVFVTGRNEQKDVSLKWQLTMLEGFAVSSEVAKAKLA